MPVGRIRTTVAKTGQVDQAWYQVDATDMVLGRLATKIALVLMGKHKPIYTPHVDTGDFVVVTNVDKIKITGAKLDHKVYARYSYYPGGYKETSMREVFTKRPERVLQAAVGRMLPKNALGRHMLKKLKCYSGQSHPHAAQQPATWTFYKTKTGAPHSCPRNKRRHRRRPTTSNPRPSPKPQPRPLH